jgi:hypothetical protein
MRSFICCIHPQILLDRENEVGRTCGTHGRREEIVQGSSGKARRKETTWKTKV